jgi:hypothetical protein
MAAGQGDMSLTFRRHHWNIENGNIALITLVLAEERSSCCWFMTGLLSVVDGALG